ncbi:MAG TPA: hypothetical protein GX716_07840, partial [Firmicutes bacterium]|nr:hypothetical protein [Candidatus Fermentithermobacillaceae bacterium]
ETTITDTNLTPGTTYTYSVAARDRAGHTSEPCAAQSGTPVDTAPPDEPQDEPEDEPEDVEPTSPTDPGPSTEEIRGASSPDTDVEIASPAGSMSLSIPAGATDTVVEFAVDAWTAEETDSLLDDATPPDGFTPVGPVIQFSATATENSEPVTSFKKPLVFELELSADDLAGITDPRKVGLYRLNDDGSLTFVGGKLVGNRLVVYMDHFSHYIVGETLATFDDIQGHWAQSDIELMAARWVARGRPSGLFDPEAPVTRAEFAIMLSRAMLLRPSDNDPGFTDVTTSDFFCTELAAAVQAGLVTGYDDGTFRPNAVVTREEMAVMIARALRTLGSVTESSNPMNVLTTYADAEDVSAWALADIAVAIEMGILRGVGDDLLAPKANATRAEAATMVARFWDR